MASGYDEVITAPGDASALGVLVLVEDARRVPSARRVVFKKMGPQVVLGRFLRALLLLGGRPPAGATLDRGEPGLLGERV